MAALDGPPTKKMKRSEDDNDIFKTFHEDRLLVTLTEAVKALDYDRTGYGIGPLNIKSCNALSSKSFSNALFETVDFKLSLPEDVAYPYQSVPAAFDLRGIFQYGFNMLDAYIKSPECIPRRKGARKALAKLLKFLTEIESVSSVLSHAKGKTELTASLSHHYLSKLAVCSTYTLDDVSKGSSRDLCCGCGCTEKSFGEYGDTSMGVPSYWHGRVDILMEVPVTVTAEEPDSPGAGNCSSFEMKTSTDRLIACKEQIRAETVVFSFLQRKKHPDLDNFLIPSIAMSKSKVAVCLYDSENDIFLETALLDLFVGENFVKIETIVTLWLVLNYRYCCSGVPEDILKSDFTADFFKHTGPYLEKYVSEVTAPCSFHAENMWSVWPFIRKIKEKKADINNINPLPKDGMN